MDYGLYVAAAGADTQSQRMEVLSNNLSNVDTPGFKAEFAILQARYSRAVQDGTDHDGHGGINDLSSGVSMIETVTDFSPGAYERTGQRWDMAIRGDGFFRVQDAQNDRQLLTRAGNFQVNARGELLTVQGYDVLDTEGAPIVVDPNHSKVHADGWIAQAGGGQFLSVVKPQSMGDLVRTGENTFRPLGPVSEVPQNKRQVESGYLENSAVGPTQAMMELIETSRMYESNVRMIQSHDQMTGSLINRVLSSR